MTTNAMTKTMTEAYAFLTSERDRALEAKCFGEWYAGSEEVYEDWLINRTAQLGEKRVSAIVKRARRRYELAKKGIVGAASITLNTIMALERRGLVQETSEQVGHGYTVKVA